MDYQAYIGHNSQLWSIEEVRLTGGKGDGMRLLQVRNAAGLEFVISADRCADLSRVIFKGINMGWFSPCGYVSPCYYDRFGAGFLESFTAGFLTTCGLTAVGPPCEDNGQITPMHGTISNTPCDRIWWEETENDLIVHAIITDAAIFREKLRLERTIACSKFENQITLSDTVTNIGSSSCPLMLLYHMNMGYPLLCENSVLKISSTSVVPRDEAAAKGLSHHLQIEPPQADFAEQCFYHTFDNTGYASVYNPKIKKGLELSFHTTQLPCFTQWKMMGVRDYVLGLEPGNCTPDGRDLIRKQGILQEIQPLEQRDFSLRIRFFE